MLNLARHCSRGVCALEGYARIEPVTIIVVTIGDVEISASGGLTCVNAETKL